MLYVVIAIYHKFIGEQNSPQKTRSIKQHKKYGRLIISAIGRYRYAILSRLGQREKGERKQTRGEGVEKKVEGSGKTWNRR